MNELFFQGIRLSPNHTSRIFDPRSFSYLTSSVLSRVEALKKTHNINALAACGNSGLPLVGAVSIMANLPFWAVRKSKDTVHDSRLANGWLPEDGLRYLIIDDLIDSGETIDRIAGNIADTIRNYDDGLRTAAKAGVKNWKWSKVEPVGILLFGQDRCIPYLTDRGVTIPCFTL